MNNKLKIALRCTKYLLVVVLVALPFVGTGETEAKIPEYTQETISNPDCPNKKSSICYKMPGRCPGPEEACLMDEIVIYG